MLSAVMADVLSSNLDIADALLNLQQAGALQDAVRSDLFPTLDGTADFRSQVSVFDDGRSTESGSVAAGLSFGFDPDLSGRNKFRLEAAIAEFEAARFDVSDARRLAARATALQYISLRRAGARLALLDTSVALQERTLEIVQSRFDAGLSPALDVDRAAADLARTEASREVLRANRLQARFALSALAGRTPIATDFDDIGDDQIPRISEAFGPGLPSDLLFNRPDVRAAELTLKAELATLGVEQADLRPSLRLPGTVSVGSGDLLNSGPSSAQLSLSALIDIPLFDKGRRKAEIRAQRAIAEAAFVAWQAATIDAVVDVETALVQIQALKSQLRQFESAVVSSENAYRQLDALYREGLASFIDVLDAQRTLISNREAIVDIEADLANAWVELAASFLPVPDAVNDAL